MRKMLLTVLLSVAVAACGGKSQPAPASGEGGERLAEGAEHEGAEHEGAEHDDKHPELTPELHAFHETLAPLWHAEAGPDREPDACAGAAKLTADADAIAAAAAPAGVEPNDWAAAVATLQTTVEELAAGCTPGNSETFEDRFTMVHDAFHGLMDLLKTAGPAV